MPTGRKEPRPVHGRVISPSEAGRARVTRARGSRPSTTFRNTCASNRKPWWSEPHAMQLMTLADAIERHVRDGQSVALEGFTHLIPFAAGHEIIRQRRRNLHRSEEHTSELQSLTNL